MNPTLECSLHVQCPLLHADWLSYFQWEVPFQKCAFVKVNNYVCNPIPIFTALLMESLLWHFYRDNMVLVLATSPWILDLWDTSRHYLSELSGTPDNIHICTASTVSTMRDTALKMSKLLAASSTLFHSTDNSR